MRHRLRSASPLLFACCFALASCNGSSSTDAGPGDTGVADTGAPDLGTDAGPTYTPLCTMPTTVQCTDNSVLDLQLFMPANAATIENMADGAGFMSHIDATAGGFTPTMSYVYAKFTDTGLMLTSVGDEAAFMSMDWDIAFRRFVIRLNSGPSGPSCVAAARTAAMTDYDSLSSPPAGLAYHQEQYYGPSPMCTEVTDGGLGGPGTVLLSYWSYPGCVSMTGNVYVLELASGRHVKLTVTDFYDPTYQMMCQMMPSTFDESAPTGGGNIRIRWAFID